MPALAIATTTSYAEVSELRCRLAQAMIREAVFTHRIPVVVVDGSKESSIQEAFRDAGADVATEEPNSTMGNTRRQALRQAARLETEVIVWMEPEKQPLVEDLPVLAKFIGMADIIVPSRTEDGFHSYPKLQMLAEQYGNETFRRLTGLGLDVWFGPRLIRRKALNFFLQYDGQYGDKWDAIFIPLLRAQKAGLSIRGLVTSYRHPTEQRQQEENDDALGVKKRFEQLQNLIPALYQEAALLEFFG